MKYLAFLCVILGSLQLINAETEGKVAHSERWGECIDPELSAYLDYSSKVDGCPKGKPFGTEIQISFENIDDYFTYTVNICRRKHKPQLANKIFRCAERRGHRQCRTIGLPSCVLDENLLYGRWQIVNDCLEKVLRRCSNGEVSG